MDAGAALGAVHFGGPDRPRGLLRDLLLAKVDATPAGESIDWATYYFCDLRLAQALVDAHRRGVRVRLVVEGDPRLAVANRRVLALLGEGGLGAQLVVRRRPPLVPRALCGKLHAKIYAFSWPRPMALIGSFNPSGDDGPDAAAIQREIGDQDRGHNLLVEVASPALVAALVGHVDRLARGGGATSRWSAANNAAPRDGDTQLFFYPRLRPGVVERALARLGDGDRLSAAVSHLKGEAVAILAAAAERGAALRLVVHDTERRVPRRAVARLARAGAVVRRYHHPDGLPMHDKFFVIESDGVRTSYFGSLNFNRNSRLLNDELLARSTDPALARTLLARFEDMAREQE